MSERLDELFYPFVLTLKRILAQDRALGLIIEFEMNPVNRVVPLAFLCALHKFTTQFRSGGLWRNVDRRVDIRVRADPFNETPVLHLVERAATPTHIVILQIKKYLN